jgi:hypothetical protein
MDEERTPVLSAERRKRPGDESRPAGEEGEREQRSAEDAWRRDRHRFTGYRGSRRGRKTPRKRESSSRGR